VSSLLHSRMMRTKCLLTGWVRLDGGMALTRVSDRPPQLSVRFDWFFWVSQRVDSDVSEKGTQAAYLSETVPGPAYQYSSVTTHTNRLTCR
jgi:hypothetical protein